MASFEPIDRFDSQGPPPRPTTPTVRRGFLVVLALLSLAALLVYGLPYVAERTSYAWESGRSRAAIEALRKLDEEKITNKASYLFRMAAKAVGPAVVNIRTWRTLKPGDVPNGLPDGGHILPNLVPFGSGSGVIISRDPNGGGAFVVTNYHVIKDADELIVRLSTGSEWPARLVGADPKTDLAVLRISAPRVVTAAWGDDEKLDVGDWVLAIGSPYLLDQTVTAGIVSATRRNNLPTMDRSLYQDFLQTDAAVNPGNSGGPLIDLRGTVVGINTAIFSPKEHEGSTGIGLAISSTMARRIVDQLIQSGRVTRGYLGVSIWDVDRQTAARLGLPETRGAWIRSVEDDSPAAKAGLKADDVVIRVGDRAVSSSADLRGEIARLQAGATVPIEFYRGGKPQTTRATIIEWPVLQTVGLRLRDLNAEQADRLPGSPKRAVVIDQVLPNTEAAAIGLRPGLRILAIGAVTVSTKAESEAAAAAITPGSPIPVRFQIPDGREVTVHLGTPAPERR